MEYSYKDLMQQTFNFPQEGFDVHNNSLHFHEIPLMDIIKKYGAPLKISYLPKIKEQIIRAKDYFNTAIKKHNYKGKYQYCYCTKSSHFSFVLEEVLKHNVHIETSSAFDMPILKALHKKGKLNKDTYIINNGYKRPDYVKYISEFINDDFKNVIPVLDNRRELPLLEQACKKKFKVGIRMATEEEPKFEFYTSRLGIMPSTIIDYYKENIQNNDKCELTMLHFFMNTGIRDSTYYWNELTKCINMYCELKKICPTLNSLDIGGGFPIQTSLNFDYDYQYMANEIISRILQICQEQNVDVPTIFTEFGNYTVGESGATIYSIIDVKQQNQNELWYMIDSSFITTLPDTWGIKQNFILLAINNWNNTSQRVNLGGLTCDSDDYYNGETHQNEVFMPVIGEQEEQYVGFFHTGAYQESIGGYGGIQHCLIPAPKHVIIDKTDDGNFVDYLFSEEQNHESMLKTLGY